MLITIGARFSVDKALPPFVDSLLDDTKVGFVNDEDNDFTFPFCPFTIWLINSYYQWKLIQSIPTT